MKQLLVPACIVLLVLFACKDKSDKKVSEITSLGDLKDYAENVVEETQKAEERSKERRKKGDTLAIPYKELQAYLPSVSGYNSEEGPKGSQMSTPGLGSWSQAEQEFRVDNDKYLKVSIMDYNAAHNAFIGLTSLYGMGMTFEDDDKRQSGVDLGIKDVKAYETVYKKRDESELVLIVSDRFIVDMKSRGEKEDFLRGVAKSMKLDELARK